MKVLGLNIKWGKILGILGLSTSVFAVEVPKELPPGHSNAGVMLNHTREFFEQQRINKEIEERKIKNMEEIEKKAAEKLHGGAAGEISFKLQGVRFSPSQVLSKEELDKISAPYVSRKITVNDLYELVNKINELYYEKGYIVCRAGLPPQTISNGYVAIILVEGKTGNIDIFGNKSTKENYIRKRIDLTAGEVSKITDLNNSLLWFNGTNDIQMRVEMEAGDLPGTTDYNLNVYEPEKHQYSVFVDNAGSETSGEYRGGANYVNNSLFGYRDQLSVTGMGSDGTVSGAVSYSIPITKKGTRLGLNYSASTVEIVDGPLKDVDVEGESSSYGVTITHPLIVKSDKKLEISFDFAQQNSKTDFMGIPWVDDDVTRYTAGITYTKYGDSSVFYNRHNFSMGSWESLTTNTKDFTKYDTVFMYQKVFKNNKMLSLRLNGQYSFDDYLPSTDQFYVGGSYSVRGYTESFMGADSGVSLSAEFSLPFFKKKGDIFVFLDGGALYGENAFDENMIYSTGIGYRVTVKGKAAISATLGVPLNKNFEDVGMEVDSSRVHIMASYSF